MTRIRDINHSIHTQITIGAISTPDLNEEREKSLEEVSTIDEQNI